jgi:hypothetical protein
LQGRAKVYFMDLGPAGYTVFETAKAVLLERPAGTAAASSYYFDIRISWQGCGDLPGQASGGFMP